MAKHFFVYIVTNKPWGTLYIGVTRNLEQRVFEHKNGVKEGFTKRYGLHLHGLCRGMRRRIYRNTTREASQEMAANLEDQFNPYRQSRLE